MRQGPRIRQAARNDKSQRNGAHAEAVEFLNRESNRAYLEHYARGRVSLKPAPPGLDTFAFDLETNDIYINSRFYRQRLNKKNSPAEADRKTVFATEHEIEHFAEKKQILSEANGPQQLAAYLDRLKEDKAFSLLDNCVADIRQNRAVVARTSEASRALEQDLYRTDLFPSTDMTKEPKHIQFSQALLREARVPEEKCSVAPEVRKKLDELHAIEKDGVKLIDAMTHPDVPMSVRLDLQDEHVVPLMKELLEQDTQEHEKKQSSLKERIKRFGRKAPPSDPNEVFKDAYESAGKKVMNSVPIEKQKEALDKWREANDPERADQRYADKLGVRKEDLQNYRKNAQELNQIINPKTKERVVAELRLLIERIIAKRFIPSAAARYPVEEGSELVDPAGLVAEVKAGNLEPRVWAETEVQNRPGKRRGKVEWTIIGDPSTSMRGIKQNEHQKKLTLEMETFDELNRQADAERSQMDTPLEVHTEVYAFSSTPLKGMGKELTEKQKIEVVAAFNTVYGSTPDYLPLESILNGLTPEQERQIRDGELKKVVEVGTDGESDNVERTKQVVKALRDRGVVVIGIGITESGEEALRTYAPQAVLARHAEDLPHVLADILKEHLADI